MELVKEFRSVKYYCHDAKAIDKELPAEIRFPLGCINHTLQFVDDEELITFPLTHSVNINCETVKLENNKFLTFEFLKRMSEQLLFKLQVHPYAKEITRSVLSIRPDLPLYGGFIQINEKIYVILYLKWGDTDFEDNQYYIHKIAEVKIDAGIKKLLFVH